jgi:hypothetical protein
VADRYAVPFGDVWFVAVEKMFEVKANEGVACGFGFCGRGICSSFKPRPDYSSRYSMEKFLRLQKNP